MKARSATQFLLTALVLGATSLVIAPVSPARGDDIRVWGRAPAAPVVTFSTAPRWVVIPGTSVSYVRDYERPNYDLFRYGSRYYIYDSGYWYRSNQYNRRYTMIDERYVPIAFADVPNDRWRSYPAGWMNPKNPHYSRRHDNGMHQGQNRGDNGMHKGQNRGNK